MSRAGARGHAEWVEREVEGAEIRVHNRVGRLAESRVIEKRASERTTELSPSAHSGLLQRVPSLPEDPSGAYKVEFDGYRAPGP